MSSLFIPDLYPYVPIVVGLVSVILILYFICYRYTNTANIFMITFTAMIFLHLDLLSFDMTYPYYMKFLDFFALENLNANIALLIRAIGIIILTLPPLLVWFIPMVMMDEKLTGTVCDNELLVKVKSGLFLCFGIIINAIFVIILFENHSL